MTNVAIILIILLMLGGLGIFFYFIMTRKPQRGVSYIDVVFDKKNNGEAFARMGRYVDRQDEEETPLMASEYNDDKKVHILNSVDGFGKHEVDIDEKGGKFVLDLYEGKKILPTSKLRFYFNGHDFGKFVPAEILSQIKINTKELEQAHLLLLDLFDIINTMGYEEKRKVAEVLDADHHRIIRDKITPFIKWEGKNQWRLIVSLKY